MSRLMKKRGFSLNETAVVIVVLGCLIALALGLINASKLKNDTLAIKQAKLESAVRTATISILGQGKLTAQQACSPTTMRDKYAEKINGSKIIGNVDVNGDKIPALEVTGYGVLAFDASADCETSWYAKNTLGSSTKSSTQIATTSFASFKKHEVAATSETSPYALEDYEYIDSPADLAKSLVIYSSLDTETVTKEDGTISIPGEYTANGKAAATSTLSTNVMAFNVTNSGIVTTYVAGPSPLLAAAATNASYNNDISICVNDSNGNEYNYTSPTCTSTSGAAIQVNFYQMLDEATCRRSFCPGNGYDNNGNLVTSGQINLLCKLGSGTVGQCECPGNKKFWVGVYAVENSSISGICVSDCSEFGMIADSETTCKCPDGTSWSSTLKQCVTPGTCPYDYLKYENDSCVCKTEAELGSSYFDVCEKWINDPTVECKTLRDNWDKSTGTCVCPSPFTISGKNCLCANPRTLTDGVCACDATKVTLTGEEVFDAASATCKFDCTSVNKIANTAKTACISPDCGCLKIYDLTSGECICDPAQANNSSCLNSDEKYDETSTTCKSCKSENREYSSTGNGTCVCKDKATLTLGTYEIYDPTQGDCIYTCKDGAVANSDHTECIGDCLQQYNYTTEKLECIQNPSDAKTTECLSNTNSIYSGTSATCQVECSSLTTADSAHKVCACDRSKVATALNQTNNLNKIYDLNNAPACMLACTGQTIPNTARTECKPVDCLYETTDNVTQHCKANPTDAEAAACLAGTNNISDPSAATCRVECQGLTSPNNVYKECKCNESKVAVALTQTENLNKVYDLNNAPACMMACQGQTFPNESRTSCRPVDCLYETTDNITQHCIANPSDTITAACLASTNYISSPTATACQVECTGLTSPNDVHKQCSCDQTKVTTALAQSNNLNKIYDLNNAPACMLACTGQTFPNDTRTVCRPVDCLYETTDNITQHCKANPTDAETTACLNNTNYKSNPALATCKEDCGTRRSPNNVYKTCECDVNKMESLYSSTNMKFDATASTCESACPSSFTFRDEDEPASCKCPRLQPAQVTVQAGYYYDATSRVLAGTYACQLECPTTSAGIEDWMWIFSQLFIDEPTAIYSSIHPGCIDHCEGNYVRTPDKLDCVCGITANDCQAGTYFDANACECKPCPVGHYCPGPVAPINCPCGTYGSVTGLSTAACSGNCPAGYYCPEASISPTARPCPAGYTCPAGNGPEYCAPRPCTFPSTSTAQAVSCDRCQTEQQIRAAQPNYFGENEIYVDNLSTNCKRCKSNMVYDSTGKCVCPSDAPYWDGTECSPCKAWGTLYFARQGKSKPNCTLYNHLMGKTDGGCFDHERVPSNDMKQAAKALSDADKARTFNGVYAYMVSYKNGVSTVEGVFTARSWYNIFNEDLSSQDTKKSQQAAGSCSEVCGGNSECVNTCNYMMGQVTSNTMFNSCSYAVNNRYLNNPSASSDSRELCTGGQIVVVRNNQQCLYGVGGILRQTISPLVLDLKGNGFKYTSVENGVIFDLNNDGVPEQTAWTTEQKEFDNAFLVLDKNKNGQVDNGGELFGDQNGSDNGFIELAKYDDNKDNVINKEDKIYNELRLWVDFNKNAKVDYEADGSTKELKTLEEAGVTELSVNYEIQKDSKGNILRDIYGNITGFLGSFKMMVQNAAGKLVEVVRKMMDVFFVTQ